MLGLVLFPLFVLLFPLIFALLLVSFPWNWVMGRIADAQATQQASARVEVPPTGLVGLVVSQKHGGMTIAPGSLDMNTLSFSQPAFAEHVRGQISGVLIEPRPGSPYSYESQLRSSWSSVSLSSLSRVPLPSVELIVGFCALLMTGLPVLLFCAGMWQAIDRQQSIRNAQHDHAGIVRLQEAVAQGQVPVESLTAALCGDGWECNKLACFPEQEDRQTRFRRGTSFPNGPNDRTVVSHEGVSYLCPTAETLASSASKRARPSSRQLKQRNQALMAAVVSVVGMAFLLVVVAVSVVVFLVRRRKQE